MDTEGSGGPKLMMSASLPRVGPENSVESSPRRPRTGRVQAVGSLLPDLHNVMNRSVHTQSGTTRRPKTSAAPMKVRTVV